MCVILWIKCFVVMVLLASQRWDEVASVIVRSQLSELPPSPEVDALIGGDGGGGRLSQRDGLHLNPPLCEKVHWRENCSGPPVPVTQLTVDVVSGGEEGGGVLGGVADQGGRVAPPGRGVEAPQTV